MLVDSVWCGWWGSTLVVSLSQQNYWIFEFHQICLAPLRFQLYLIIEYLMLSQYEPRVRNVKFRSLNFLTLKLISTSLVFRCDSISRFGLWESVSQSVIIKPFSVCNHCKMPLYRLDFWSCFCSKWPKNLFYISTLKFILFIGGPPFGVLNPP